MALRECCDVYGTANGVRKYRIIVNELSEEKGGEASVVITTMKALCPRGKARLLKGVERLTSPPTPREKK